MTTSFPVSQRAGRYIQQLTGYRAFVPAPLPPDPDIEFDGELRTLLSQADRDIARLDAIAALLPNPDLFVAMYVRHEAVLSSQIEGTQSTLEDVLAFEAHATAAHDGPRDVEEVVNYVRAMNHGLARLAELPLSLRLLREIHAKLMHEVRGGEKSPGEFRTSQNWIGATGSTLATASFVPPPPHELMSALGALETFLHQGKTTVPLLIRCGLAHAQFETIHPFLDGNGRIGRLLIAALLQAWGLLQEPLMYLSGYLKQHQGEYYRRLSAIRSHGDWEAWVQFFLEGVASAASQAEGNIIQTASLIAADRKHLLQQPKASPLSYRLFELLPMMPRFTAEHVRQQLQTTFPTASAAIRSLQDAGIVTELTGQKKNRIYSYQAYVELLSR